MKSSKVLEMIMNGQIEQLKEELKDEIYAESLKSTPNAKKRYSAMKKYFTYVTSAREALQKPAMVEFEGRKYTSFTNSYSLVLTTENPGEIPLFDEEKGNYPNVTRLIRFDGEEDKIDFADVIARAKALGYKLNKKAVTNNDYLMLYKGSYYRIGLVDSSFRIIDDSSPATVYYSPVFNQPLTVKTSIGVGVIMPIRYENDPYVEPVIIEV